MNWQPHQVVVVAWDQAMRSGFAIIHEAKVVEYGLALNHLQRKGAFERALALASHHQLPLIVAFEGHDEIPAAIGNNTATLLGLGAAKGRILECAEMLGIPSKRIVKLTMRDWRRRMLGLSAKRMRRTMLKKLAVAAVQSHVGVTCTDDEAEAILIGLACLHHPAVAATIAPELRGLCWEPALEDYMGKSKAANVKGRQTRQSGVKGRTRSGKGARPMTPNTIPDAKGDLRRLSK